MRKCQCSHSTKNVQSIRARGTRKIISCDQDGRQNKNKSRNIISPSPKLIRTNDRNEIKENKSENILEKIYRMETKPNGKVRSHQIEIEKKMRTVLTRIIGLIMSD